MLNPDPRAYRVALVADAVVNDGQRRSMRWRCSMRHSGV
jgi:hypothetical protein